MLALAALNVGDQLRARPGRSLMSVNACCFYNDSCFAFAAADKMLCSEFVSYYGATH